jgi:peptide/nickel transport system substrate-binding protein
MAANTGYWEGSPKGKPQIANIKFRTIKDPNTRLAELMTGAINWIWDVPKDQAVRLEQTGRVQVVNAPTSAGAQSGANSATSGQVFPGSVAISTTTRGRTATAIKRFTAKIA